MFLTATPLLPVLNVTITKIVDGDTIYGVIPGNPQEIKIRLACGDAPELNQPGGKPSRDSLLAVLPPGTVVEVRPVAPNDRYNRTPAFVFFDGENINLKQIRDGHAWFYPEYSRTCPEYAPVMKAAEAEAKLNKFGLWDGQLVPCRPAEWRANKCVDRPDCKPVQ
jgi:endonuclease YncB( thermonuclease family)